MSAWQKLLTARHDWQGRHALVPPETCHRILDLYSWGFAVFGTIAVGFVGAIYRDSVLGSVAFWVAALAVIVQWAAAVLRGLPFLARYFIFVGNAVAFMVSTVVMMAITPNWSLLVILLLSSAGLFFGTARALWASAGLLAVHIVLAWCWVTGRLPPGAASSLGPTNYTDFHSPAVWVRVLFMCGGLLAVLQLLMRYVLREMNLALDGARRALQAREAEQERRASAERRFAAIFHDSPDICGVTRLGDGRIIDVNRAFETLTGWPRSEAVGRTTTEIGFWAVPGERERMVELVKENGGVAEHEISWRHRDGQRKVGQISARRMEMDGEAVINVVIRDLTGRRRRERALQAFSELTGGVTGSEFFAATARHLATELGVRFALIVEISSPAAGEAVAQTLAAWAGGPVDNFSYRLPGSPCANVIGQGLCHYPDGVAELFPADRLLTEMGARSYAGLPIRDNAGRTLGLVAVLDNKPMPDREAASLLLVLIAGRVAAELQRLQTEREISRLNAALEARVVERTAELAARVAEVERLAAEQQTLMQELRSSQQGADRAAARLQEANSNLLVANQELEAFSYSVSHDLRAPLRNITGFLELLARRPAREADPEAQRYLGMVGAEAQRMGLLIDDLLTFSRIGRTELQVQRVDIGAIFVEVRESLQAELAGREVEWRIGPLPAVQADPALLRQVVLNLLGNAAKFTRKTAAARIEVGATPPTRGERRVTFFVRDNGAGFNPRYVDKLFGVFQRLHNSRDFEGTGIGLANVKRIISRHGGRVWAEGQIDRGATFYFSLASAEA